MNFKLFTRLALENIKKNSRTIVPYMIAGIFSVMLYFIIRSMAFNDYIYNYKTGIEAFTGAQTVAIIMEMSSGIITFFSILFLFYANQFIVKGRKKELGLYGILGLAKYHIAEIMAIESFLIMTVVILVGVGLGIFLNKIMLLLLFKILGQTPVEGFFLNTDVLKNTIILFAFLYLAILVYNVLQVNVSQPIALLQSGQRGEKEPKVKWGILLLGVITMACGYGMAISCKSTAEALSTLFVSVLLVIIGTYCLFISGSIYLLNRLKKNKKFYYRAENFVSISGLIYRMKHNAAGLAGICVLSTGVILLLTCGVSLFLLGEDNINKMYPRDISMYIENADEVNRESIVAAIDKAAVESGVDILESVSYEYVEALIHRDGNYLEFTEYFPTIDEFFDLYIMTLEEYNRVGNYNVVLADNEVLAYNSGGKTYEEFVFPQATYQVVGECDKEKLTDISDYSMTLFDKLFLIVPDKEAIQTIYQGADKNVSITTDPITHYYGYNVKNPSDMENIQKLVEKMQQNAAEGGLKFKVRIKEEQREWFYGMYGGIFYVGIFLSILFLMATVMIIYYKQTSEGYEDRKRYEILEKVGMTEKEIKVTIHRQVMMMFFLPVGTAILHMLVASKIIRLFLSCIMIIDKGVFLFGVAVTSILFLVVYTLVYRITSKEYYKIVYKGI